MNYLIYDLIIAAILLIFVYFGQKRGLVMTLCGLLAMFVSFIGAGVISNLLYEPIAQTIEPWIESGITRVLEGVVSQIDVSTALNTASSLGLSGMNQLISNLTLEQVLSALQKSGQYQMVIQSLYNALEQGILSAVSNATTAIAVYLSREITRTVLFTFFSAALWFIWKLFSRVLNRIFRLPVLSTINRVLGGVIGFGKGALLVCIGVWLLKNYLPPQALTDSYLLRIFAEHTPAGLLAVF